MEETLVLKIQELLSLHYRYQYLGNGYLEEISELLTKPSQ